MADALKLSTDENERWALFDNQMRIQATATTILHRMAPPAGDAAAEWSRRGKGWWDGLALVAAVKHMQPGAVGQNTYEYLKALTAWGVALGAPWKEASDARKVAFSSAWDRYRKGAPVAVAFAEFYASTPARKAGAEALESWAVELLLSEPEPLPVPQLRAEMHPNVASAENARYIVARALGLADDKAVSLAELVRDWNTQSWDGVPRPQFGLPPKMRLPSRASVRMPVKVGGGERSPSALPVAAAGAVVWAAARYLL